MAISFDDILCEAVVDRDLEERTRGGEKGPRAAFRKDADAIYRNTPIRRRGVAFSALYQKLFRDLGHRGRLTAICQEMGGAGPLPGQICFAQAVGGEEEGAQLSEDRSMLGIRIRCETLRQDDRCAYFLRHELTHIQDLLDPEFGHDPSRLLSERSSAEDLLFRDRYRTLWDLSVDGRLDRCGKLPRGIRERRAAEFWALFPRLDAGAGERVLEAFWAGPRPSDKALRRMVRGASHLCGDLGLSFAVDAEAEGGSGYAPGAACPLCGFTTFEWAALNEPLTEAIQSEFPSWNASQGICTQCANRYLFGAAFGPRAAGMRSRPARWGMDAHRGRA